MKHDPNSDRLRRSPSHLLHRAGQCAADIFHAEMKDGDLTPRQLAVLVTVANNEGLSQTGLVERTGIDRSTLADIVSRMLKKGLLQRRRTKEDARAYAVKLTEEGRRILRSSDPLAKKLTSEFWRRCRANSANSSLVFCCLSSTDCRGLPLSAGRAALPLVDSD